MLLKLPTFQVSKVTSNHNFGVLVVRFHAFLQQEFVFVDHAVSNVRKIVQNGEGRHEESDILILYEESDILILYEESDILILYEESISSGDVLVI